MELDEELDRETLARTLRLLSRYMDLDGAAGQHAEPVAGALPHRARGPRQHAILALPEMADADGVKPAVIAARIDYSVSNTYTALQSLARAGMVEVVPGIHPQRWRLSAQHRHSAAVLTRLAATVLPGEWTTCADISIASRGDTSAAWMVCWAATKLPDFPSRHRVLAEGGVPHPYGHEHQRERPETVRAVLTQEGVRFGADGRAGAASRVAWDQLRSRART